MSETAEILVDLATQAEALLAQFSDHDMRHMVAVVRGYRDLALMGDDVPVTNAVRAIEQMRARLKEQ